MKINQDVNVEKLRKKHEQEKVLAKDELNKLRSSFQDRELKMSQDFSSKYDVFKQSVETMNIKFQEKIDQFESANSSLKRLLQESSKYSEQSVDELRKKYEMEISNMVTAANDKYQKMLIEQLSTQEQLKKGYEERLTALSNELNDKHSLELNKELGQLRAMLNAEKQEIVLNHKHEMEERLTAQKNELCQRNELLLKDLKHQTSLYNELEVSSSNRINDLQSELELVKRLSHQEKGGNESQLNSLKTELSKCQDSVSKLKSSLKTSEEELNTMKTLLDEKNIKLIYYEDQLKSIKESHSQVVNDFDKSKVNFAAYKSNAEIEIQKLTSTVIDFKKEKEGLGAQIIALQREIESIRQNSAYQLGTVEKELNILKNQKLELELKLQQQLNVNADSSSQLQDEMSVLRNKLKVTEELFETEKSNMVKANQVQLQNLMNRFEDEKRSLLQEQQNLSIQQKKKEESLVADIQHQQEMYESRLKVLDNEASAKYSKLLQSSEEERVQMNQKLLLLQDEHSKLMNSQENEKLLLKSDYNKLEHKYKTVAKELETKKYEMERHETITTGLKQQIEQLREELKSSQRQYAANLSNSLTKVEEEWMDKLQSETDRLLEMKKKEIDELLRKFADEKAFLLKQSELEINEIKLLLQKEVNTFENEKKQQEIQNEYLRTGLENEKQKRLQDMGELELHFQKKFQSQEDSHQSLLTSVKKDLQSQHEQVISSTKVSHEQQIKLMQSNFNQQAEDHSFNLKKLENAMIEEKLTEVASAVSRSEQNLSEKYESIIKSLKEKFEEEKSKLEIEIKAQTLLYETEKKEKLDSFHLYQEEIGKYETTLQTERNERQRREEKFMLEKDSMQRDFQLNIRKEKEEYERKIVNMLSRHDEDMKLLHEETSQASKQYEEKIEQILKEYGKLQQKYQNRESRPEDILKIERLEEEIIEKTAMVQKIKEEMNYFKREMLNREENYNQKFNKQPNIGVMQVIKPKEGTTEPPAFGKGKGTTMHVVNPNGGNFGAPGMGLGSGSSLNISNAPPNNMKLSKSAK